MSNTSPKVLFHELGAGVAERERCWIATRGRRSAFVALKEGAPQHALSAIVELLESRGNADGLTLDALAKELAALGESLAAVNLVLLEDAGPAELRAVAWGTPQLWEVTASGKLVRDLLANGNPKQARRLTLSTADGFHGKRFVAAGGALDLDKVRAAAVGFTEAETQAEWERLMPALVKREAWSALVFPALTAVTFRSAGWPYDPFVGSQEGRAHERRGLAAIASALFRDRSFDGMRFVPTEIYFEGHADLLYDGVLVSPWGVFLLEVKDYKGRVILHNRGPGGLEQYPHWPHTHSAKVQTNPAYKMLPMLKEMGNRLALKALNNQHKGWLTRIGALVFTHPNVDIRFSENDGAPYLGDSMGAVAVGRPDDIGRLLREKVCANTFTAFREPPLDRSTIDRIVQQWMNPASSHTTSTPSSARRTVGRYEIESEPIEKTVYASVYPGHAVASGKKVWLRRLDAMSLVKAGKERSAALAAFRENVALQEHLPADPRLQRVLGEVEADHELFVVLEPVDDPTLDQWLLREPSREARVSLLRQLAELLLLLEQNRVVHRALSPTAVRVREGGQPVLTNFELCYLDSVATLSAEARQALDRAYIAPETDQPGIKLKASADVYSFGRLSVRVLTGALPYPTHLQQATWSRAADAYLKLSEASGIPEEQLKKMFAQAPGQRATPEQLIAWSATW